MSKKTGSQMEEILLDRIEKAKTKLEKLQQKHKLEIGTLAYKHGLHQFDMQQLDLAFSKIVSEVCHEHS
ncbi:MAG: hypothetical protein Q8R79_08405 [Legionellaceae bacterium]|nr:hypothetical protein [Legionellaceae bacterium]